MNKPSFFIGIDTGGTYTDAVLLDAPTLCIVHAAKVPTAAHDPARSIQRVLRQVLKESGVDPQHIAHVHVSTTLATNALVEEKGADVGLFVIGFDKRLDVPAREVRYIPGGHKARGIEVEPLGMEFVVQGIAAMQSQVDAYAVCALLGFEDPTHELVVAKAIELMDPKPVFCSHQASSRPGMHERAATAVLNARLLPIMRDFLHSIAQSMQDLGLDCPVRIVRGDAQVMDVSQAMDAASSTVASGPAATAIFGSRNAQESASLVVDVGGTTTDITLIRHGQPVIGDAGMVIGKWRTHVRAVEMYTAGIGGDSLVRLDAQQRLCLGPARVLPLCLAHEHLTGQALEMMRAPHTWIGPELRCQCVALAQADSPASCELESQVLNWLRVHGPATAEQLRTALSLAESQVEQHLSRLLAARHIIACGFTPTDALHVLGELSLGDARPARAAAAVFAADLGLDIPALCHQVLRQAERVIAETILSALIQREHAPALIRSILDPAPESLLDVSVQVRAPVIGIGAAAPFFLPAVAERLGTHVVFPPHYAVGNAVGAAMMPVPDGELLV
ncbi:hydantoinase/oxoprolinase family protein [Desulfovibrionales bacterium]